jgi:DNA primase
VSEYLVNLFKEKQIPFTSSGKDYVIKCLNPEHPDSNPSLRVDKITGVAHCFACGWKRNLFKHFGIVSNNNSVRVAKLKEKIKELKESNIEVTMLEGATPYTKPFRNLSVQTLKHFGAFYTYDVESMKDRVIFPLYDVTGKINNVIGRHILSDANPKYLHYPSGKPTLTFPIKLEEPTTNIVIVEGIIDMLNMYDKGARNVVCVFGTQSLKVGLRQKLYPYKVQGINKIYILFDGDEAGRTAATDIKPYIEEQGFVTEILNLPDEVDPGELDEEAVLSIKGYTNDKSSNYR